MRRRVAVWTLMILSLLLFSQWQATHAQNSDLVLDEMFVDIDGVRAIDLSPDSRLLAVVDSGRQLLCLYAWER